MNAFNGSGYGEIRTPSKYGLIAVLVETDFHDNPRKKEMVRIPSVIKIVMVFQG